MPLPSLARRMLGAAVVAVVAGATSACVFDRDPPVRCDSIATEDCDRAVERARPLLAAYWEHASEVWVHPGVCTQAMECSPRQRTFPAFITVELVSDQPDSVSVVIDRQNAEWTAQCRLIVPDAEGAHGEACAAP